MIGTNCGDTIRDHGRESLEYKAISLKANNLYSCIINSISDQNVEVYLYMYSSLLYYIVFNTLL